MELETKYYQLIFKNGKEFFVESKIQDVISFLLTIQEVGQVEGYFGLTKINDGPVDPKANNKPLIVTQSDIFSCQEISIGNAQKKWRLA